MANVLEALMPKILARGLLALRGATVMPRLVNTDYSNEAKQKGNTIDVPIPSAIAAVDVTPGATPPANTDTAWTTVPIPLDQWKEAPFYLTDKEVGQVLTSEFLPLQASEAVKSLASAVNQHIFAQCKDFYGFTGTPGTTPFAADITDATAIRKVLNKQLCPLDARSGVLDVDAAANALALPAFNNNFASGDGKVITEGQLGRKLGFNWYEDQEVPTHTTTTTAGAVTVKAVNAVGVSQIIVSKGAGADMAAKLGDIFTIAGDPQTYVITENVTITAGGDSTVKIAPKLQKATAGAEAVTFEASHVMNVAFNRFAIAFATRPLQDPITEGLGNKTLSAVDPVSGLTLRLEVSRQHKQTRFSYDILYGAKTVRRELGGRIAG